MSVNFKWAVLAAVVAAFGGWACGSDDGGGGKSGGDICDEKSSSFDADACEACMDEYDACLDRGVCQSEYQAIFACMGSKCGAEFQAAIDCEEEAYDSCSENPDLSEEEFDACVDAKCASPHAAAESCGKAKCMAEANAAETCWATGCPKAAACSD
ncbi:MAG TPA: hypothetical protein VGD74_09280 [Vulgatibacter sp.]